MLNEEDEPMPETVDVPQGELMLRTLAMPADTNANGDIFGGWLLSQMDIAGGLAAKQYSHGRIVTIAINAMTFHQPVYVGDVLCCYASILRTGNTSMTIQLQAWVVRQAYGDERIKVTEGVYTYVAVDEQRRPRPARPA